MNDNTLAYYIGNIPHKYLHGRILDRFIVLCIIASNAICLLKSYFSDGTTNRAHLTESAAKFLTVVKNSDSLISRICFGYAETRQEFEDLRQDVLINLWQGIDSFKGNSAVSTWVYRVTLNTCVSTLRKKKHNPSTVELNELYDLIDEPDSRVEMLREMHRRISKLSPTDKALILLWLDEVSYEDISEMTGLPRNTVATRLRRAKEKLQQTI